MISTTPKAYLVGGGIGSLAAAAFLIRDGGMPGANISILDAGPALGGALDGAGDAERGYSMRGGRMLTTDNYERTWGLFKSIPSLTQPGRSVFDETAQFNETHVSNAMARLVDRRRAKVPVASMGFSMQDRLELLTLADADEASLGTSCITDHLSPAFFETEFWFMWSTTFAFQPWHSAVEFRRYLHRFVMEFSRIETLGGVKRTVLNACGTLRAPALRPGYRCQGQLHPLPYALHHEPVHAARARRPAAAGTARYEELRLRQPVRRDPAGHGLYGRVLGAGGATGGVPVAGHHEADSAGDAARQVAPHAVRRIG
jgi:hypothetical protein|nr:oleate hydratase [uncultured Thiodictyon sp.]